MKNSMLFAKRNLTEMVRDPLLYIFCVGFPVAMIAMFQIIGKYSPETAVTFNVKTLIPGLMMFSYTLLMLMSALLVSKDKSTAFLRRLFTSPLKAYQFILGYFVPFFLVGLCQSVLCIALGYIFGAVSGTGFATFGGSVLLIIEMLPMLITNIMIGMIFGSLLNDKSAPAMTSIFISASGILGGAWMPVETMGGFEKAVGFLPFYPSVYLGRMCTGAKHLTDGSLYSFDVSNGTHWLYLGIMFGYLILTSVLAIVVFTKKMKSDRF